MSKRGDGELAARLATVAERAAASVGSADAPLVAALAERYYAHVPVDDLLERDPGDLARTLVAHFEIARQREPGSATIHVWSPPASDGGPPQVSVVDIVTDDMPFLVDSVRMVLNVGGALVSLVVHPQVRVTRDANGGLVGIGEPAELTESFLHFEIGRQAGADALDRLGDDVRRVLGDVRAAVEDWPAMHERALDLVKTLEAEPPPLPKREVSEGRAFLKWLAADHFTFLGYREYDLVTENGIDALHIVEGRGLGILRGPAGGSRHSASFLSLPVEARRHARDPELLLLTKANSRSTVHRPVFLDYVGIRRFDAEGNVTGECRFLGLYSSSAYHDSPRTIPVLRRKYASVLDRAGFALDSHSGKDLVQTLETYPRDELFQISTDDLLDATLGILELQERQRVRLFVRRDLFGRFFSCLVFIPRERYTTTVRQRVERVLVDAFGGHGTEYTTRVSESVLARFHFVVFTDPVSQPVYDVRDLERRLEAASRSWADSLSDELVDELGEDAGDRLAREYATAFPAAYQEDVLRTRRRDRRPAARGARPRRRLRHRPLPAGRRAAGGHQIQAVPVGRPDRAVVHPSGVRAPRCHRRRRASVRHLDGGRCHPVDLRLRVALPARMRPHQRDRRRALRGRVRAGVAGRRGVGRVQPPGRRRRPHGTRGRGDARAVPLHPPDGYSVQPGLHRADAGREPPDRPPPGRAVRSSPRSRAARPRDRCAIGHRARARHRRRHDTGRRPDPAHVPARTALRPAHECVPARRRRTAEVEPLVQDRIGEGSRPSPPPTALRDLRVLAARRRRAPAGRIRRAWRSPLVGPPGGLPHRGPRADEGADREERGHRPGRSERRVRRQAAAARP